MSGLVVNSHQRVDRGGGEPPAMPSVALARAPATMNPVLTRAMGAIRAARAPLPASLTYDVRRGRVCTNGHPGSYAQVWFQTGGCRLDRRGECTMCNYGWASAVTGEGMVEAVRRALAEAGPVDVLYVSPSGSLLDEDEVPRDALRAILAMARAAPGREFLCETRPHTVTETTASLLHSELAPKQITVEMGLESANSWILRYSLNKSITLEDYDRAMTLLRAYGIRTFSNVLLGAPFLSEAQAIRDAVASARWALSHGTHSVVIFPAHVRRWTLLSWLWEAGLYRPPSLWSLVEVLRTLGPEHSARVGISWYWQPTGDARILASPTTCEACGPRVRQLLHEYRAARRFEHIEALTCIRCHCKDAWREACAAATRATTLERLANAYQRLGREFARGWWERHGDDFLAACAREYYVSMGER